MQMKAARNVQVPQSSRRVGSPATAVVGDGGCWHELYYEKTALAFSWAFHDRSWEYILHHQKMNQQDMSFVCAAVLACAGT
jgi:hypothetical protein